MVKYKVVDGNVQEIRTLETTEVACSRGNQLPNGDTQYVVTLKAGRKWFVSLVTMREGEAQRFSRINVADTATQAAAMQRELEASCLTPVDAPASEL